MSPGKPSAESQSLGVDPVHDLPGEASAYAGADASPRVRRGWVVRRALLAADVVGLLGAFFLTEALFSQDLVGGLGVAPETAIFIASLPVWIVAAKLYGLYDRDEERATHSTADEVVSVFHLITVGVWVFYATSWIFGLIHPSQEKLATFWVLAFTAVIGLRFAARTLARRHPAYVQNTIIVGAGDVGQLIARKVLQHPEYGINLLGFADGHPKELRRDVEDVHVFGGLDDVVEFVRAHDVDRVVVAFSQAQDERLLDVVRALRSDEVQIDVVPRLFDTMGPNSAVHSVEGLPLLSVSPVRIGRSSLFLKRAIDVCGASLLLVLTAPLLLVIGWRIRRETPGPVFYRQRRLGMDMGEFTLFKFRTMKDGTDDGPHREYVEQIMRIDALPSANNLYKLDRSGEVTRTGGWLRRTSLDEVPQLVNVLKGDMSLVGPRPAIPYELELYAPHHFERFAVPAGLTGLWQVEARAHATFREALDLDVAYARGWSLSLDLRLLLRTPLLMLRRTETS
jgi:exopolysaccharide biosynthesis polyprenyl glycosylphosphotransferase